MCTQIGELLEACALGVLDEVERLEVEAHLQSGCHVCAAELARSRERVAQLAYLAPEAEPPAGLRERILEKARATPQAEAPRSALPFQVPRRAVRLIAPLAWLAAAAAVLLAVYTAWEASRLRLTLGTLQTQLAIESARQKELLEELQRGRQIAEILAAPDAQTFRMQFNLKEAAPPAAMVTAFWKEGAGLVLSAQNLPGPASSRTLQLWIVPRQGAPLSAGVFRPDEKGAVLYFSAEGATFASSNAAALAITEEPAGGSPGPTTTPAWSAPVRQAGR